MQIGDADARRGQAAKKKRWALVYPNYEYGQSAAATFKKLLKKAQPDVEFVTEQAPPLGKIDAGAVAQALDDAKPDAIFNVAVRRRPRQVRARGQHRAACSRAASVVSLLAGEPEYLDPLKDEAPVGWIVTGYPWNEIKTPEHKPSSSTPTRRSTTTIRGSARSSATSTDQVAGRRHRQGGLDRHREAGRRVQGPARSTARSVRSPIARSTIRRPWAPMSARSRSRTARAPWPTSNMSTAAGAAGDAEVKKLRPAGAD